MPESARIRQYKIDFFDRLSFICKKEVVMK